MKTKTLHTILLGACVVLLASCVSNKKFEALQTENDQLAQSLADLQTQVSNLEGQNTDLSSQNDQLNSELSGVKQDLSETESRVSQVEKDAKMKADELAALQQEVQAAFADVNQVVDDNDARIKEVESSLYIDMADTVQFQSASATVSAEDRETIEKLAVLLTKHPNLHLVIEGNADKRSINNDQYKDNWELSAARSIAVVRQLVNLGVNPNQLTAAGRAEFNQVNDGDSPDELAQNRRIELMVVPKVGKLYKTQ